MTGTDERAGVVWRVRLLAGIGLLTALAFRQAGGLIVPDTKLDLTANPWGFLQRALHMWDPNGAFGQLQNQAYGYLFPVGPFHALLIGAGVPAWVVQRLWWSVILSVAFVGMWRLSGALRMGSPWARYLAALLYAVSPRFLAEVAVSSVEVWPMAMAPWVLLPLVTPAQRSWRWRITASACAFALIGGINAVATGAALVLPTLWFVTRARWRHTWRPFLAWLASVTAVSLWWLGPLILLGRYSPPFLDWIEDAQVTTAAASPFEALRGTTPWLNYLSGPGGPSWPAGWLFVTVPVLIVVTTLLAMAGAVGLVGAPRPHRSFLLVSLLMGLVLVTLGHTGAGASPFADILQHLLDGPLAPLRNTHKFELVIRIPLTLGLAVTVTWAQRRLAGWGAPAWLPRVVAASVVVMVAAPAVPGGLARPEGYSGLPEYWRQAATWLDSRTEPGTVLVVPATGFADFQWGSTKDEPLQALSTRPFAVRDAVPLGSAGATRWLDAVEANLRVGRGGPALLAGLRQAGVREVVVRNDLRADAIDSGAGALLRTHQALAAAGLARVATFGPILGSPPGTPTEDATTTTDQRTHVPRPALEVYAVPNPESARLVPADRLATVSGGPEDVPDVYAAFPQVGATIVGSDRRALPAEVDAAALGILTDGAQRRERFFGRASDNASEVLTATDSGRTGRRVSDYISDRGQPQTVRAYTDPLVSVTASSSASDANATLRLGPGYGPQAAVDGDPSTSWVSGSYAATAGQWLRLDFARPINPEGLTLTLESAQQVAARPATVRVDTARGSTTTRLGAGAAPQPLSVHPGDTTWVRIKVTVADTERRQRGVAIAEVGIPGLDTRSTLTVPAAPERTSALLLRAAGRERPGCAWVVNRPLCLVGSERKAETEGGLRRTLDLDAPIQSSMTGTVMARPGPAVEALLTGLSRARVTASSRAVSDPAGRPDAVMDGELATGWVASPDDPRPVLNIDLQVPVTVDRVQFQRDPYLAASRPRTVLLAFDGRPAVQVTVDAEGYAHFPVQEVHQAAITFEADDPLYSVDSASHFPQSLPVGVSEVVFPGYDPGGVATVADTTGAPCGYGPALVVAGRRYDTRVTGTLEDVLAGRPLSWSTCGSMVDLPAGKSALEAVDSAAFRASNLRLGSSLGDPDGPAPDAVVVERPDATTLRADLPRRGSSSILVAHQNFSSGWSARTATGVVLQPVRVDGWQQGWIVPAGTTGIVTATLDPDVWYVTALLSGAVALLVTFVMMIRSRGEHGAASPPARTTPSWVGALIAPAAFALTFGWAGLAAIPLAALAWALPQSRVGRIWGVGILAAMAALMTAFGSRWPQGRPAVDNVVVQALVLAVILVVSWSWSSRRPSLRRRFVQRPSMRRPQRMIGRSSQE